MESAFVYEPGKWRVTEEMKQQFDEDGFIIARSLLSSAELGKLKDALERDDEGVMQHAFSRGDGQGCCSRLCLWNHPGNDITGMVGRCEKVAGTMEELLGGEVYHYHTKLMMKEAHTGGSFVWHQDYGYWYNNGFLYPDMGTVFIAIDKCNRENGCLKVLKGSQKLGRINHKLVGGQMGADLERVDEVKKILPMLHVELEPGDALFFHCNLLHQSDQNRSDNRRWAFLIAYNRASNPSTKHHHLKCTPVSKSDQNRSDNRRWAFLIAYNRASNNPVLKHHHPQYTPLSKMPDSAILNCTTPLDLTGKDFMDPDSDKSLRE